MEKTTEELLELYISQLSEMQKQVMNIAEEHLETSYNISKSNGFITWMKDQYN